MLFIEETSPPPFYQEQLTPQQRTQLDKWFIGHRSQAYYLKRFAEFDKQGYLSPKWNWAAFFATFGWLLYRKRYLDCIVYTVAGWSFIQLNMVIILVAFEFAVMPFVSGGYQMMTRIAIAGLIWLFWSVMVARWSDAYYYRMARREIADVVADYSREPEKQKAILRREGGVSLIGLAIAFALFSFLLLVIHQQFLPLYAKPKAVGYIQQTFTVTRNITSHVEDLYRVNGHCPQGVRFDTSDKNLKVQVVNETEKLGNIQTSCVVIAEIEKIPFPNRNLNEQLYIMYRTSGEGTDEGQAEAQWHCVTSLNDKQKPKICQGE